MSGLPELVYGSSLRKLKQIEFQGLNHVLGAGDGDIWDMQNLTGDHIPVLATREKRCLYRKLSKSGGLFCWDGLAWVDGTTFYYKGEAKGTVGDGVKTFGALGPYIVILPDKVYYNVDTDTFGDMEAKWSGESLTFTNGLDHEEAADANAIQCTGVNWESYFRAGDAVTISGCTKHPENNKTDIIRAIDGDKLYFYEYAFTLEGDDGTTGYAETGSMSISRTVPDLKYLCENENRLWGCTDTTIYACKPGDIFNWNVYDGLDSDAWTLEPGTTGYFTGAVSYKGYPIFFKEEHIGKVYGSLPSNFQVMESATMGLAEGSHKSLAVAGEILFYLSRSGIVAYSGGIPQCVGAALGRGRFRDAVAGSDGLKYYVSMTGEDGERWLYVYDTQRGIWHKEDRQDIMGFAYWDGNLYFLNSAGEIWITSTPAEAVEDVTPEADIPWIAEFADFTEGEPNKKGVGKLQIRLELDEGAEVSVYLQFDSDGVWRPVRTLKCEDPKRSYVLPIVPRRCDHYRLKLAGTGGCRIYSLAREVYAGSELKSKAGRN